MREGHGEGDGVDRGGWMGGGSGLGQCGGGERGLNNGGESGK